MASLPTLSEGIALTHFIVAADVGRAAGRTDESNGELHGLTATAPSWLSPVATSFWARV